MDFSDLVAANAEVFGESVTYTAAGGTASAITAIVNHDSYEREEGEDGLQIIKQATVIVDATDVSAPTLNDCITIGDDEYAVAGIEKVAGGDAFSLQVRRAVSDERSRPGLRKRR